MNTTRQSVKPDESSGSLVQKTIRDLLKLLEKERSTFRQDLATDLHAVKLPVYEFGAGALLAFSSLELLMFSIVSDRHRRTLLVFGAACGLFAWLLSSDARRAVQARLAHGTTAEHIQGDLTAAFKA